MIDEYDEIQFPNGLVPLPDGWFKNVITKETIAPDGRVFNEKGELVEPK